MNNLPKNWISQPLGEISVARRGLTYSSNQLSEEDTGIAYINMKSFKKGGGYNSEGLKFFSGIYAADDLVNENDLLIANTDVTLDGDIVGVPAYLPRELQNKTILFSHHVTRLRLANSISAIYLSFLFNIHTYRRWMLKYARGTTVLMLDMHALKRIPICYPVNKEEQLKITTIFSAINIAIEKTEALIQKYQQIKAGLMHDLFTRGVTADGKLRLPREQAPELYQQTSVGWIPNNWEITTINTITESLVDGPFGSNLKTEHYVSDPGFRVVRLQNIQATKYNDSDKAFISEKHAEFLVRNKVIAGDILVAGLGEDRYPVGRACLYPDNIPHAINKADCFRLRCHPSEMLNAFLMFYLNTHSVRAQIKKYEQGVTRPRINTGNLKKVLLPKPELSEQKIIAYRLMMVIERIDNEITNKDKLLLEKQGLMQDLLTGKVRVKFDPPVTPDV